MTNSSNSRLERIIKSLGCPRIMVFGDVILDHYIQGQVQRISPEAPIPVLHARGERYLVGGAGNVANNLVALEARTLLVGVVGDDVHGEKMRELLAENGIEDHGLIIDRSRRTTLKSRMIARSQQLLRVDHEDKHPISEEIENAAIEMVRSNLDTTDLVIISDYAKGLLTDRVLREVIDMVRGAGKKVIVDPKGRDYQKYRGATSLTPNLLEAQQASNLELESDTERKTVGTKLLTELELEALVITLGKEGMLLIQKTSDDQMRFKRVRSKSRSVFDVTGAGDSSIATMGLVLAAGRSFDAAVSLANRAGGIVVGKLGTATVTRDELIQVIREDDHSISGRLTSVRSLIAIRAKDDKKESKLGIVVGSFKTVTHRAMAAIQDLGKEVDRIVVMVPSGCRSLPVLEDLRSCDHVLATAEMESDLKQLSPAKIVFVDEDFEALKPLAESLTSGGE